MPSHHNDDKSKTVWDNPVRCVYATKRDGIYNMKVYQVHEMKFFSDFFEEVGSCGHLPKVSLEQVKELEKDVRTLDEHNKDLMNLKQELEKLQVLE